MNHSIKTLADSLLACLFAAEAFAGPAQCRNGLTDVLPPAPVGVQRPTDDLELLNLNKPTGKLASTPSLDNRGLIDGIYECNVSVNGATEKALITFNGKANGQTLYAVAGVKTYYKLTAAGANIPAPPLRGWGIGAISAAGLSGATWNNLPFSFTLLGLEEYKKAGAYDVLRLSGKIGIDAHTTAQLTCKTDRALF